jgi:WD40 repeat protein
LLAVALEANAVRFSTKSHVPLAIRNMMGGGLRVFDRDKNWQEVFEDVYDGDSYGVDFSSDGRLATTSWATDKDAALIRLYGPDFRIIAGPVIAQRGRLLTKIDFSPNGNNLAVSYQDYFAVDIFDAHSLVLRIGANPSSWVLGPGAIDAITWSPDGTAVLAAGRDITKTGVIDAFSSPASFAKYLSHCGANTTAGLAILPGGDLIVASEAQCLMRIRGDETVWSVTSATADLRGRPDALKVSADGELVDFGFEHEPRSVRFDVRTLRLGPQPADTGATLAPKKIADVPISGWREGAHPVLAGARYIDHQLGEIFHALAIAPDASRFFLGSSFALSAYDMTGTLKWHRTIPQEVWAVNASGDGRLVVATYGDGTIHWIRANDGSELLTLQILSNKIDWVLWTPEGFYEATPGAQDVLKWVVNHGPDSAATTLPVSAITKLHRPNALPHVLDQLETAHALGVDDITQARLDVQAATGSAKPPGGVLHVLAIGVDKFGDKAGDLHLDYAAEDAHDVASALFESQKGGPGKASLYADVDLQYLPNDKADGAAIIDHLEAVAQSMAKNEQGQDTAVILVSSHGEMIDGQFYLIPYGFDPGSQGRSIKSAVSASEFAKKVAALAAHGKVLLLLDACHSGAVGAQEWAKDPDAKVLQDAMDLENVTVLTSSRRNELSEELPEWKHGALAEAFLDALKGGADSEGIVRLSALTDAMENEVQSLTKGRQHLGMHVNFSGDLFMASHY